MRLLIIYYFLIEDEIPVTLSVDVIPKLLAVSWLLTLIPGVGASELAAMIS